MTRTSHNLIGGLQRTVAMRQLPSSSIRSHVRGSSGSGGWGFKDALASASARSPAGNYAALSTRAAVVQTAAVVNMAACSIV